MAASPTTCTIRWCQRCVVLCPCPPLPSSCMLAHALHPPQVQDARRRLVQVAHPQSNVVHVAGNDGVGGGGEALLVALSRPGTLCIAGRCLHHARAAGLAPAALHAHAAATTCARPQDTWTDWCNNQSNAHIYGQHWWQLTSIMEVQKR